MNIYFAPLEGITGFVLRNAYESCFPGTIDRYFAPFIAASCRKKLAARDLRDVLPENNTGICLIPQLLANKGEDFISTAQMLYQFGYRELNLNLGCPSATVVTKKRGAGLLTEPELLKAFLTECYDWAEGKDVKISIKTRIGMAEEAEWEKLLSLYEAFPVSELIIHPRLREDYYQGRIREEMFAQAYREITGAARQYDKDDGEKKTTDAAAVLQWRYRKKRTDTGVSRCLPGNAGCDDRQRLFDAAGVYGEAIVAIRESAGRNNRI